MKLSHGDTEVHTCSTSDSSLQSATAYYPNPLIDNRLHMTHCFNPKIFVQTECFY